MGIESTARCDLVLLSWNHLEVTRPCVESILAHTTVPCRLIVVDQNSDDQTQRYLRSVRSTPTIQVELIFNPSNVGYPRGMNQGLRHGRSPFVCFLNNDILVPPGWLEELIRVVESDPTVGTVCPASNTFDLYPPAGADWLEFAKDLDGRRSQWMEIPYGEGFCLLARRSLLEEIGGFDETTYEQIYFEDADLGRRVQEKGLRCVMALGTYVWHHGGKTMNLLPDKQRLFEENRRRFIQKWGEEGSRVLFIVGHPSLEHLQAAWEQARIEANRRGRAWIVVRDGLAAEEALPRHLSVQIQRVSGWQIPWVVLRNALIKKKKMQAIRTDLPWLRRALQPLHFLHRAAVQSL